jgi:hypothetical protein
VSTRRFRIDPTNTFAAVIVRNDTSRLLSRLGHDHVIRAREFTSTIVVDTDQIEAMSFSLTFPVEALDVDAAPDREQVGLAGRVSEKDRTATRENMLAKDQLDVGSHGNIHFHIRGARDLKPDSLILLASLTVRNHRCDFDFPVTFTLSPHLQVAGSVDLTHTQLGLKTYRAPMGTLQNRETITFVVDADVAPL